MNFYICYEYPPSSQVYADVSEIDRFGRFIFVQHGGATKRGADARRYFSRCEGLGYIIISPGIESFDLVALLTSR